MLNIEYKENLNEEFNKFAIKNDIICNYNSFTFVAKDEDQINNTSKISPTIYLKIKDYEIDGKTVLYINVPDSSEVYRCNGRIYNRNEDGDIFRATVPLIKIVNEVDEESNNVLIEKKAPDEAPDKIKEIVLYCSEPRTAKQKWFSYSDLMNDERIQKVNSDIIEFVKEFKL